MCVFLFCQNHLKLISYVISYSTAATFSDSHM